MSIPTHINEKVQDLERELISELQKQFTKKIAHTMIMMKFEDGECVIGNLGDTE